MMLTLAYYNASDILATTVGSALFCFVNKKLVTLVFDYLTYIV
jgi:hypothetical protein